MINSLNPSNVFKFFLDLTKIPRGSGNTDAVSKYCADFAKERGLWYNRDEANNVIIKKAATPGYENYSPVIIQGHTDMVCEKTPDCNIDFEKDALNIKTDGEFIFAEGTTLGADDGIAVAYALAVLDSDTIEHPPLEVVLTTDEETGMDGAMALDTSLLEGKTLLNIDSENEGIFTVSCAGGLNVDGELKLSYCDKPTNGIKIRIYGLTGGHSGVEIDKKRANANIVAAKLLLKLTEYASVRLSSINGGLKHNAIPSECELVISSDKDISDIISSYRQELKTAFSSTDPDLDISVESIDSIYALSTEDTRKIAKLLAGMPDGIFSMSEEIDGLVKTSSNLGILKTENDVLYLLCSLRSSDESEKKSYSDTVLAHMQAYGLNAKKSEEYPAWEYLKESPLRNIMCEVFEKMYQKPPVTEAIHAGLECGIFCGKIKGLDCVSFGPDMLDIHTPKERLNIKSVQRTWEFLQAVLKNLKL